MAVTRAEISEAVMYSLGITKDDAKAMVESLFEEIRCALEKGESVKISGFGNFEVRNKKELPGRNPKTGKSVPVSARRVVSFKTGQKLKKHIEKYQGELECDKILEEEED
jgi:integration host factor subunit alpha